MPLNIHVDGDLGAIRATADSVRRTGSGIDQAGSQVERASSVSGGGWHGDAGEAFRAAMGRVSPEVEHWAGAHRDTGRELDTMADQLAAVRHRMEEARGLAAGAGLVTTPRTIADPGPGVGPPGPRPVGPSVTLRQRDAHAAATEAFEDHQRKVRAFNEAAAVVQDARAEEKAAHDYLMDFLSRQLEHPAFLVTDFVSGVAGASIEKTSKYRRIARGYENKRARWEKLSKSKHLGAGNRVRALLSSNKNAYLRDQALQKTTGRLARATDAIPDEGKRLLTGRAAGKLPWIGTALTAFQTQQKIEDGMHPAQAVASGAGSLAAGMAVGAMVGGPVGAVAGMAVAAGVGYVVDEWGDDIAEGVGDAAEEVGDFVTDLF